ncbi:hypothetical protein [Rheinheimera oceanensis]|uniref:hypothetical protein n=2 Tax=Rheinheimera oceanensis TaxID=2817449 RepID=UPI001C062C36|nr:hypothetical protein [Rheinheimera oceanensis]
MLKVFIDHNIWDELFARKLDLECFFPTEQFTFYVTKHGKYEVQQTPESCMELKEYINRYLDSLVKVDAMFGFHNSNLPPDQQRSGGFGIGRFSNKTNELFRKNLNQKFGTSQKRKSTQIFYKQEADIELAVRSLIYPVLTLDIKPGPLKEAQEQGGKVILLERQFIKPLSNSDFVSYIKSRLNEVQT